VALVKANKPQLVTQGAGESLRHAAKGVLDMLDGRMSH